MVLIEPEDLNSATLSTSQIVSTIKYHAASTALILLPGIQYYTGQYLDIEQITAAAHAHHVLIGWDLAHAVGNVILELDKWDIDFAVWCNYKYVNSGPGAIGGLYVNPRHGKVDLAVRGCKDIGYRVRLSGWWGGDKAIRFEMGKGRSKVGNSQYDLDETQILYRYLEPLVSRLAIHRRWLSLPSSLHWKFSI